jgi:hypothetical protein
MATNNKQTGKTAASTASKLLRTSKSPAVKTVAASDLAQARLHTPKKTK